MRVAIESGKGMKVKVVKLCWNKWNGPFLMHIYDKQCGIMQKNQWKGSNFQIQCFYNGTSGALCWKRQKTPKLEKLKRKLLNFLKMYDLYRVVPWESQRPDNSENVVVFEFWRFQTIVIGRQSWVKIEEKLSHSTHLFLNKKCITKICTTAKQMQEKFQNKCKNNSRQIRLYVHEI